MPTRKPTKVLELSGAFKKDPQRRRTNEPVPRPGGIGQAPRHLTESQRACWDAIVRICPDGVAQSSDRISLEMAAVLLDGFRREGLNMKASLISRMDMLLARFGLSPADRSRVAVDDQHSSNPFARI